MLFTFPSRYSFALGLQGVLSLGGWSRLFRAGFHVPRATRGVTCLFSPPAATKMFQFTAFAHLSVSPLGGVPPFGHPRVNGCLRLAGEFRRLSRPSSPLGARASSVRPCLLLFSGRAASAAAPVSPVMMSMCVSRPSGAAGWRMSDSNRRPPACRAGALAS